MALQAAFNDRRFRPVRPEEMEEIEVEISLLTPLVTVKSVELIESGLPVAEPTPQTSVVA